MGNFKFDMTKPQGMKQKIVDSTKINELVWRAGTDLITGLNKSYDFYRNEYNSKP